MIDVKSELKDYRKIDLEQLTAEGKNLPENVRNSITLYNKALTSLANGSEDIALIELKKAVSMNPNFNEALNLLGICYSNINDIDKAAEIFDMVLKAESNGVKAQKYLRIVKPGSDGPEAPQSQPSRRRTQASPSFSSLQSRVAAKKSEEKNKKKRILRYIACFAAGALLVWLIGTFVKKPVEQEPGTNVDTDNTVAQEIAEYKEKYDELNADYQALQGELEASNKKVDYYQTAIKLYEAESLASEGQYVQAADMLILLKTVEFTGEEAEKLNKLNTDIMPKAALALFNEGTTLYNGKKYEDAIKKYERVQIYDPNFSKNDLLLYNLGRCYQLLQDSRSAVAAFQKLIDTYPKSAYVKNAKNRIAQLTQIP